MTAARTCPRCGWHKPADARLCPPCLEWCEWGHRTEAFETAPPTLFTADGRPIRPVVCIGPWREAAEDWRQYLRGEGRGVGR